MTAMPAVKPAITGCGTYLSKRPNFNIPSATRINPARKVATTNPSYPREAAIAANTRTKAPVGPANDRSPKPLAGCGAGGNAKAHRQRQRNDAHRKAGAEVLP